MKGFVPPPPPPPPGGNNNNNKTESSSKKYQPRIMQPIQGQQMHQMQFQPYNNIQQQFKPPMQQQFQQPINMNQQQFKPPPPQQQFNQQSNQFNNNNYKPMKMQMQMNNNMNNQINNNKNINKRRKKNKPQKSDKNEEKEQPKKITLFGDGFLDKAKVEIVKSAKSQRKEVELPKNQMITEQELFKKYKMEGNRIGEGSFARVKIVTNKKNGNKYALKMIKKKGKTKGDIRAVKKEILYLLKLNNHPNIIKLYDFCETNQGLYMVIEYCDGGELFDLLQKQQRGFSEKQTLDITRQCSLGLHYSHINKIVHRDMKMENLMYNGNVIKIIDFGLAGDLQYGLLNTPCGTPHYAAPEVISSNEYDTSADMWSLGVIIYMLLCGFPPFFVASGNNIELNKKIMKGKFSFVSPFFDKISNNTKDLINKLLIVKPQNRLTAIQVLSHPAMTTNFDKKQLSNQFLKN